MGRPPLLDEHDCAELVSQQRRKDFAKDSATSRQLQTIIYEKRVEKAKKEQKNSLGVEKSISKRTLAKYKQLIVPVTVKTAKKALYVQNYHLFLTLKSNFLTAAILASLQVTHGSVASTFTRTTVLQAHLSTVKLKSNAKRRK